MTWNNLKHEAAPEGPAGVQEHGGDEHGHQASCMNEKCLWYAWCAGPVENMDKQSDQNAAGLRLPIKESLKTAAKNQGKRPLPKGKERILIVDDEQPIVDLFEDILERLGYAVVAETSSLEAFELFREDPSGFDLVITDMTMPDLDGECLVRKLKEIRGDIPVIMCTGNIEAISAEKAKSMGICEYITKPMRLSTLVEAVRKVLDKGR